MQYIPRGRVHFEVQRWKILNKKKIKKKDFANISLYYLGMTTF